MNQEIDSTAIVLHDSLAPVLSTAAAVAGLRQLQDFVGSYLKEGNDGYGDYGTIPGTKRPTLFKSGAEKLCDVYGFTPSYEITERVLDWEGGLIFYEVHARLIRRGAGDVVGEGWGSCNSRESKFQITEWWNERSEPPAGEGWKKGKSSWSRKVAHPNPADLANNVLKTAKKRALVDAVLGATRSSGLFTQDMEDVAPAPADYEPPRRTTPTPAPATTEGTDEADAQPAPPSPLLPRLVAALKHQNLTLDQMHAMRANGGRPAWDTLTPSQQEELVIYYEQKATKGAAA